jgi:perosamine synthetase
MVAPVVLAGLIPVFYGIDEELAPQLHTLDQNDLSNAGAIIVPHYFGRARSLATERRWCDERQIALIEDCAHCLFGWAGDRPVGAWGDFATASLTKFLPVPEAGLLASAKRPIFAPHLESQGCIGELRGWFNLLEQAQRYGRLRGLNRVLAAALALTGRLSGARQEEARNPENAPDPVAACDMARADKAPLKLARVIIDVAPRRAIISRRRQHLARLRSRLDGMAGARVVVDDFGIHDVPYALPLWVDDTDRVYHGLKSEGMPVFRWDNVWPGTPELHSDRGGAMSRHVLQLLCHQSLLDEEIEQVAESVVRHLRG